MSAKPEANIVLSTFAITLALVAGSSFAADPVRDSFDRMLSPREPAAAAAAVAPGPADPLVTALVVPLRDGIWPARAADPVAESFARLFEHEPNRASPPVPAGEAADPLIAAVARPLLRSQQIAVAGLAPGATH